MSHLLLHLPSFSPQVGQQLFPTLKSLRYEWFSDPESSYAAVAPAARIQHLRSLTPGDFVQFVGHLPVHRAHLMAYGSTEVDVSLEDVPQIHLTACLSGIWQERTPYGHVVSRSGGAALLPPGDRQTLGSGNTAVLSLSPLEVGGAAASMAGRRDGGSGDGRGWQTFQPRSWEAGSREARQIHDLVHFIDRCAVVDPSLPAKLALDDVLHRLVAALLVPSLLEDRPPCGQHLLTREGHSAFDDLIAYIRAHLDQPLRLSDLKARSHYSRRSLQYAFQKKLHNTPTRWIRQQRLKAAMEQLQAADGPQTVRTVALGIGYQSLSHFCSDFKREFGISASRVRRTPL